MSSSYTIPVPGMSFHSHFISTWWSPALAISTFTPTHDYTMPVPHMCFYSCFVSTWWYCRRWWHPTPPFPGHHHSASVSTAMTGKSLPCSTLPVTIATPPAWPQGCTATSSHTMPMPCASTNKCAFSFSGSSHPWLTLSQPAQYHRITLSLTRSWLWQQSPPASLPNEDDDPQSWPSLTAMAVSLLV